jgi:pyrroloquinoline quinone (PQQ) biosynthesis protein C
MSVEAYRNALAKHHDQLTAHPAVRAMFDPEIEPRLLHRFLIEYCSLGVQLTQPVEGWIRRAGARCKEIGLAQLGDSLIKHAVHEAGHERLFIDDTRKLSEQYLARYGEALDAEALLSQPATRAMTQYIELHEETIAGSTPYAQVAIELEIEGLSVSLGPTLLKQLERVLGAETVACCSFLTEHVAIDVGHTALNQKMMERLTQAHPEALPALVSAGQRALDAYLGFLLECIERARAELARSRAVRAAS